MINKDEPTKLLDDPVIHFTRLTLSGTCAYCLEKLYGVFELRLEKTKRGFLKVPASRRKPCLVKCRCGAEVSVYPGEIRFHERRPPKKGTS